MAATSTDVDKRILRVTGQNYSMWAFWMKTRLLKKGLWRVVNTGPTTEEKPGECDAMHSTVLSVLCLNQFYPEFLMQQLRRTCGRTYENYTRVFWLQVKMRFIVSNTQVDQWKIGSWIQSTCSKAQEFSRRFECNQCCACCTAHFFWYPRAQSTCKKQIEQQVI